MKKIIVLLLFAISCAILIPYSAFATDAYYTDIVWSYDGDNNLTMTFEAVQTFTIKYVSWAGHEPACVYNDPRAQASATEIPAGNIMHFDNARLFLDAGSCNVETTYTIGQTYTVYFIPASDFLAESITSTSTEEAVKGYFTNWEDDTTLTATSTTALKLRNSEGTWEDQIQGTWFEYPAPELDLTINYPSSSATTTSSFTMGLTYNLAGEDYQKIMIIFESWDASSTCPVYGTQEHYDEWDAGWLNYQSFPYFSPELTATSTEATTTIAVSLLNENVYNCVRCYFINEDLGTMTEEQCTDYSLTVSSYTTASQPLPTTNWGNYYSENSDEKFATSTEIFNTIASVFENLYFKLTDYLTDFIVLFDTTKAESYGEDFGEKIPLARGYLKPINDFFGGFPISELFIFAISINLIMIFFRITKAILHIIRG